MGKMGTKSAAAASYEALMQDLEARCVAVPGQRVAGVAGGAGAVYGSSCWRCSNDIPVASSRLNLGQRVARVAGGVAILHQRATDRFT